jgi:MFS transporter, ACS family, tartrate transporter
VDCTNHDFVGNSYDSDWLCAHCRTVYAARFFLGVAESSFFPGTIVYLTHWFRLRERSRAIACLYAAVPAASLSGSPVAGWLLGVHWWLLAGWRWLFILEGIPAIVLGIVTVFYLTDWPVQARWLHREERNWLVNELQAELQAKKKIRSYTIMEAFCDLRILRLIFGYFLALTGALGTIYWIPTFVKCLSGFSNQTVTSLLLIPALMGIAGMLTTFGTPTGQPSGTGTVQFPWSLPDPCLDS